jgi:cytochrome c oxidase subunit 2
VLVKGHQWWWEFQYTDLGVTTANELHIPVNIQVNLQLESNDVIHSFWVPHLAGKTDVIPGRQNHLWLQADEPGTYQGQCAEFCGIEHALMRLQVVAESQSDFNTWVQGQRAIPSLAATPTPGPGAAGTPGAQGTPSADASLVAQGAQLFATGACITCHTLRGTPAQATVGPDLTHFASRKTLAANTLTNTPANLAKWLHNPQAIKPGNDMPNLNLSDSDVDALVAYLESLK